MRGLQLELFNYNFSSFHHLLGAQLSKIPHLWGSIHLPFLTLFRPPLKQVHPTSALLFSFLVFKGANLINELISLSLTSPWSFGYFPN